MKTYEIVFSPTGGTRKVADTIASTLSPEVVVVDLTDPDFNGISLHQRDEAVIAVPSHSGRVPKLAAERLRMVDGSCARATLVVVYGNRGYDDTLIELQQICFEQGFNVIAGITAIAQHSLVSKVGEGRPDAQDNAVLTDFANKVKDKVVKGKAKTPEFPGHIPYRNPHHTVSPRTSSDCKRCGTCAEGCPSRAIDINDPTIIYKDLCNQCMRCVTVCPNHCKHLPSVYSAIVKVVLSSAHHRKEPELFI